VLILLYVTVTLHVASCLSSLYVGPKRIRLQELLDRTTQLATDLVQSTGSSAVWQTSVSSGEASNNQIARARVRTATITWNQWERQIVEPDGRTSDGASRQVTQRRSIGIGIGVGRVRDMVWQKNRTSTEASNRTGYMLLLLFYLAVW